MNRELYRMFRRACLLASFPFLLAACGGYSTKVVNTSENGHLKGHQKPYTVNGKRYDPLSSHAGFTQEGMASWYGRKFHGRKTSNGEIYDMYAMTGAHKTLPMGTQVKVVNLQNGREVVIRINDRGPFVRGRIIDLSYAAAKQVGLVGPGTARVRIETLGQPGADASNQENLSAAKAPSGGSFAVQIGSFTSKENARRLVEKLQKEVGAASIHQNRIGDTLYFRVNAGRYPTLNDAEIARNGFERQGYGNCLVIARE
jgi:rare lipoprotein A